MQCYGGGMTWSLTVCVWTTWSCCDVVRGCGGWKAHTALQLINDCTVHEEHRYVRDTVGGKVSEVNRRGEKQDMRKMGVQHLMCKLGRLITEEMCRRLHSPTYHRSRWRYIALQYAVTIPSPVDTRWIYGTVLYYTILYGTASQCSSLPSLHCDDLDDTMRRKMTNGRGILSLPSINPSATHFLTIDDRLDH